MAENKWVHPDDVTTDGAAVTITASSAGIGYTTPSLLSVLPGDAYRFGGLFRIMAGGAADNDTLDFIDTTSIHRTATLTAGDYSGATLATEVGTQMTSAGNGTYACSYSATTGKFTIEETGGPSAFTLKWDTGSAGTARLGTTLGYDTSADDSGASSYLGDNVVVHSEDWVKVDLGAATIPDVLWFNGHFLSSSATVRVYSHTGNIVPTAGQTYVEALGATGTLVNTLVAGTGWTHAADHQFGTVDLVGGTARRWWWLHFIDTVPANSVLYHEIGRFGMGDLTSPTQGYARGFSDPLIDPSVDYQGAGGVLMATQHQILMQRVHKYAAANAADKLLLENMWKSRRTPFPFWWDWESAAAGGFECQCITGGRFPSRDDPRLFQRSNVGPLVFQQVPRRRL